MEGSSLLDKQKYMNVKEVVDIIEKGKGIDVITEEGTKNHTTSPPQKSRNLKKKSRNLSTKNSRNLSSKKLMQPLHSKKIMQPHHQGSD